MSFICECCGTSNQFGNYITSLWFCRAFHDLHPGYTCVEANQWRRARGAIKPTRDPHDVRHGDHWEVRDGKAVIVGSNDWPPPAKGTHESDLHHGDGWLKRPGVPGWGWKYMPEDNGPGGWGEYTKASIWSRS